MLNKKSKTGKGYLYLTENQLSKREKWCVAENHDYMCHIHAKGFLDSTKLPQNFTYSQKSYF